MKTYRIQVRYKSNYYDAKVKADDDFGALVEFFKQGFEGKIKPKDEGFSDPGRCFVTYEEVDDVTEVNIGETTAGVAMGQQSVSSG
jgi:hypothetical protein|tara:strand:+ start:1228 stop:1485 length:258 start_codon:yes stop_codon:yes gene_type:complete